MLEVTGSTKKSLPIFLATMIALAAVAQGEPAGFVETQWDKVIETPKSVSPSPREDFNNKFMSPSSQRKQPARLSNQKEQQPYDRGGNYPQSYTEQTITKPKVSAPILPPMESYYQPLEEQDPFADAKSNFFSMEYRLKVGDELLVSLYGQEKSDREVVIDRRGKVSYLFVDSVPAAGRTIKELRLTLEEELKKHYRFVMVSITPTKLLGDTYTIMGEVISPGRKKIMSKDSTLLSAVCEAGGFTTRDYRGQLIDLVDLDHSFLSRNGDYFPVDFNKLVSYGDLSQDVKLEDGDYIYIKYKEWNQIYILGAVGTNLSYDYLGSVTLAEAIAEAGGLLDFASNRVVVIRGSLACPTRYLIDITRILKGYACDFQLLPGDIVYVPERRFTFIREVLREAVRSFVANVGAEAGTRAFISTHPHAEGDVGNEVNIIGGGVVF